MDVRNGENRNSLSNDMEIPCLTSDWNSTENIVRCESEFSDPTLTLNLLR